MLITEQNTDWISLFKQSVKMAFALFQIIKLCKLYIKISSFKVMKLEELYNRISSILSFWCQEINFRLDWYIAFVNHLSASPIIYIYIYIQYGTSTWWSLCLQMSWYRRVPGHQQAECWLRKLLMFYWNFFSPGHTCTATCRRLPCD